MASHKTDSRPIAGDRHFHDQYSILSRVTEVEAVTWLTIGTDQKEFTDRAGARPSKNGNL